MCMGVGIESKIMYCFDWEYKGKCMFIIMPYVHANC